MPITAQYKVKQYPQEDIRKEIEKLVLESQKDRANLTTEKNIRRNKNLEFWKIEIDKDMLFYYLNNNRTLGNCRQYIEKEKAGEVPDNYFDMTNTENLDVQQAYHQIIYKHADVDEIVDTYNLQKDQRDPLYINFDGVVANGNTRLSVIREKMKDWPTVECLVYPKNCANDWMLMENHTAQKDNQKEFGNPDPWYGKADTANKYKKIYDNDLEEVAKEMNLLTKTGKPNIPELEKIINRATLAQEFLDWDKSDKYEIFEDLASMGPDDGLQVFKTLNDRISSLQKTNKLDPAVMMELKEQAFHAMSYGLKGQHASMHLAIQRTFSSDYVKILALRNIEHPENKTNAKKFKSMSRDDRNKLVRKTLDASLAEHVRKEQEDNQNYMQDKMRSAITDLRTAKGAIRPDTNIAQFKDICDEINKEIEAIEQKIKDLNI